MTEGTYLPSYVTRRYGFGHSAGCLVDLADGTNHLSRNQRYRIGEFVIDDRANLVLDLHIARDFTPW